MPHWTVITTGFVGVLNCYVDDYTLSEAVFVLLNFSKQKTNLKNVFSVKSTA